MRPGLVLAAVAALAFGVVSGRAFGQDAITVAIDVDVAGNDGRTVGAVNDCASIDTGSELEIDVVLPDPGISTGVGIKAWQFDLVYDASVVTVSEEQPDFLVGEAKDSDLFAGLSDPLPDSDGRFTSAAFDNTEKFQVEPEGAHEIGPGVITRITLSAVSQGSTNLTLAGVIIVDAQNNPTLIGELRGAAVAVDGACETPPPPTVPPPPPSPAPPPETGDDTPVTGTDANTAVARGGGAATPGPGGTGGTGGTDATGGEQPPVLGGTPVFGAEGDASGLQTLTDEGDGDGLSAAAWAGIGLGIAAAVAAASAAGWFALRRRTEGQK